MKFFVYILLSRKDKKLYIGQTNNIQKRLQEHWSGKVRSTRNRRPLISLKEEIFYSRTEAMKREKFLKSLYGLKERRKILKEFLLKNSVTRRNPCPAPNSFWWLGHRFRLFS